MFKLTLPNANNRPTSELEKFGCVFIMALVIFDLIFPKIFVLVWYMLLAFVTVPKAAVDEYGNFFLEEDKVRVSFYVVVATPAGDAVFLEDFNEL